MSLSENEVEIYWKLVSDVGDSDIEKALDSAVLEKEKSIKKLDGFFSENALMVDNGIHSYEEWMKYISKYELIYGFDIDDIREISVQNPEKYADIKKYIEADNYEENKAIYSEIEKAVYTNREVSRLNDDIMVYEELIERIEKQGCNSLLPPMVRNMVDKDMRRLISLIVVYNILILVPILRDKTYCEKLAFGTLLRKVLFFVMPMTIISSIGYLVCILITDFKEFYRCSLKMGNRWEQYPISFGMMLLICMMICVLLSVITTMIGTRILYGKNKRK